MAGTKRTRGDDAEDSSSPKPAKVAKTKAPPKEKAAPKPKVTMTGDEFKEQALPLHINISHTPPSIPDESSAPAASSDPGFLGHVSLLPSVFSTGSFGWKGSKNFTVKSADGTMEEVQVSMSINATVKGSKPKAPAAKKPAAKKRKAKKESEGEQSADEEDDE